MNRVSKNLMQIPAADSAEELLYFSVEENVAALPASKTMKREIHRVVEKKRRDNLNERFAM